MGGGSSAPVCNPFTAGCPPGFVSTGLTCGRGGGSRIRNRAPCGPGEELNGLLCYPKCRDGYQSSGCCVCQIKGSLSTPATCPDGTTTIAGLCYDSCNSHNTPSVTYSRHNYNIGMCGTNCPNGFKDIGIGGCERPTAYKPGKLGTLTTRAKTRRIAFSTKDN